MDNTAEQAVSTEAIEEHSGSRADPQPDAIRAQKKTTPAASRGARLAKLGGTHALVVVLALSLFAAADSWNTVTGLGIAGFLCVVTGALAGVTIATLVHEWFHLVGARYSGAKYDIPSRQGLFVYEWDFDTNSARQFLVMSVAGSVGGLLSVLILWYAVPADSWGRAALRGAAIAGVIYAAWIEWPVIRRTRISGDPLSELLKIDKSLLTRSFYIASIAGVVMTTIFVP
jgi:hypothetical protein